MTTRSMALACSLAIPLLLSCDVTDPNVEPCGDHCPGWGAGGSAGTVTSGISGGSGNRDAGQDARVPTGGSASNRSDGGGTAGSAGTSADAGGSGGQGGTGESGGGGDSGTSGSPDKDAGGQCPGCPAQQPHCDAGACVQCVNDDHCPDGVCVSGSCVECEDNSDCTQLDAARCSSRQCVPCRASGDCQHFAETPLCRAGSCVRCTSSDYHLCGTNAAGIPRVCESATATCTTQLEHSAGLCDPCISDAQCKPGQLCVMQTYDDPSDTPDRGELEVGRFCFWREDSAEPNGPAGDCANAQPFVDTRAGATSVDGVQAAVCSLRVTTCIGYKHYSSQSCTGPDNDSACGDPNYALDAYCEQFSSGTYRCTTPCGSNDDCDIGFTCNAGPPKFCNLH